MSNLVDISTGDSDISSGAMEASDFPKQLSGRLVVQWKLKKS